MIEFIYPLEYPLPATHERFDEFRGQIRSQGEPIVAPLAEELLPIENCYWNVKHLVQQQGGRALFGWMMKHWPGLYLAAEHHAVWERADGEIIDVTERQPVADVPTTFLLDANQEIDVSSAPNVPIEYLPISQDQRVEELLNLSGQMNEVTQAINQFLSHDLGHLEDAQAAVAAGKTADSLLITPGQHYRFQMLTKKSHQFRQKVGVLIESLIQRPPNSVARQVSRKHRKQIS